MEGRHHFNSSGILLGLLVLDVDLGGTYSRKVEFTNACTILVEGHDWKRYLRKPRSSSEDNITQGS
jgi:hypothetical protein